LKYRVSRIARGERFDVAARFLFQHRASGRIALGLAHQRGGQHPGALDARHVAVVRRATHVSNAPLRIPAAEADDPREQSR
jgi:hypothetical protein